MNKLCLQTGVDEVAASQPNMSEAGGETVDKISMAANDQEMGLAVAILELIGSQPHITVNPPVSSNQQGADQVPEFVDVPVKGEMDELTV